MKNATKILFVSIMTMLVALPFASVSALSLQTKDTSATNFYKDARRAYNSAVTQYENAREDYKEARLKYQQRKDAPNTQAALDAARTFLLKADMAAIDYIELVQAKVKELTGIAETERTQIVAELQVQIDWLEARQDEIEAAQDKDTLVNLSKTVSDYWDGVRADTKEITGEVLAARINYVIDQLETVAAGVEEKIDVLKEDGQDTSDLEALLEDYNAALADAQAKHDKAVTTFNSITVLSSANTLFNEGRTSIRQADQDLRKAHNTLKEIVKDLKNAKLKNVVVVGTGRLYTEGTGKAVLDGQGTMSGSTSSDNSGKVVVVDRGGDATIDTKGLGNRSEIVNADGDKVITYTGVGDIVVKATDAEITVTGNALNLLVEGEGTAKLSGDGTYRTSKNGKKYDFSATPITIQIQ